MAPKLKNHWKRALRHHGRRSYAIAAGCIALAAGALVLTRAGAARPTHNGTHGTTGVTNELATHAIEGSKLTFDGFLLSGQLATAHSAVLASGNRSLLAELKIQADEADGGRVPTAIAVVLDKSGSMSGMKIVEARRALSRLVSRLGDDDHVSIVVYDNVAEVKLPLTRVSEVRGRIDRLAEAIAAGGGTNIPSGIARGVSELRRAPSSHVTRVVLLSDGQDGSGVRLEDLSVDVTRDARRGITLSALGIGTDYDEQYMSTVAEAGLGNYGYLANADVLRKFIESEIEESSGTVVDSVVAKFEVPTNWRFKRAIGANADQSGTNLAVTLGPIASGAERRVVMEFDVQAPAEGSAGEMAMDLHYRSLADRKSRSMDVGQLPIAVAPTLAAVEASRDWVVWGDIKVAMVDEDQQRALDAWRAGRVAEARSISARNRSDLQQVLKEQTTNGIAPSKNLGLQLTDLAEDEQTFKTSPSSKMGRAASLNSNSRRMARKKAASGAAKMLSPQALDLSDAF